MALARCAKLTVPGATIECSKEINFSLNEIGIGAQINCYIH